MKELALHILDIAENSVNADADNILIDIKEDTKNNDLEITIEDDGKGIKKDQLKDITDPFVTSRKTRPVGLGLSLFKAAAKRCDGNFLIDSNQNGTIVKAEFKHDHIDRAPLGNIAQTIISILLWDSNVDLTYKHRYNTEQFIFETQKIKEELGNVKITDSKILNWLKEYIDENVKEIRGGEFN
ncbi:MAG TPA: ATP-binding protein [Halanaerobiales bacterium]|nr:ATP-binding protein [Halanaerobiales bacterium]